MRNLKKVLSLALAMVMLLGMMVVGAGAATSFKDDSSIPADRQVAAAVANKIEVLIGDDDGNFNPDDTLTRAEAAVILARLDLGATAASALTATDAATFTDVAAGSGYGWAKPFIDYCAGNGYMVGVGDNRFAPAQTLTSVEFGLMISRVLGYRDANEGITGAEWSIKAAALAHKAGLGNDVAVGSNKMTRADMAQMVLNALTAPMVEYEGMDITIGDVAITSKATNRTHTGSLANNNTTYDYQPIQSNITPIRLCEEKFPDLKLTQDEDAFKRVESVWTWKRVNITGTEKLIAADYEWTEEKSSVSINGAKGGSVFVNGKDVTPKTVVTATDIAKLTGNGRLVQVFLNDKDNKAIEKVVVIDTYVGEITAVKGGDTPSVTVTPKNNRTVEGDAKTNGDPSKLVKSFKTDGFEIGNIVAYTAAYNSTTDKYDIQSVKALEVAQSGKLTKWNGNNFASNNSSAGQSNFTVDDTQYKYSMFNVIENENNAIYDLKIKQDVNVYVDEYDFALYIAPVTIENSYAAVIGVGSTNAYGSETNGCTLLFPDGTIKAVDYKLVKNGVVLSKDGANQQTVNDIIGDVVSYTVDEDDVYTLTLADAKAKYVGTAAHSFTSTDYTKFDNGKSSMWLDGNHWYTTSKTVFFVATGSAGNLSYTAYTGYAEMPSFATTGDNKGITGYAVTLNSKYASQIDAVYISAAKLEGAKSVDTYFVKPANAPTATDNTGTYYILNAIVKGEETTVMVRQDACADFKDATGVFAAQNVIRDKNDIITSFTNAKGNAFTASAECGAVTNTEAATGTVRDPNGRAVLGIDGGAKTAKFYAYGADTKVYVVDSDYKTISISSMSSVQDDGNDEVFAAATTGTKVLTDVIIVEKDNDEGGSGGSTTPDAEGNVLVADTFTGSKKPTMTGTNSAKVNALGNVIVNFTATAPAWAANTVDFDVALYVDDTLAKFDTITNAAIGADQKITVKNALISVGTLTAENEVRVEITDATYTRVKVQYVDNADTTKTVPVTSASTKDVAVDALTAANSTNGIQVKIDESANTYASATPAAVTGITLSGSAAINTSANLKDSSETDIFSTPTGASVDGDNYVVVKITLGAATPVTPMYDVKVAGSTSAYNKALKDLTVTGLPANSKDKDAVLAVTASPAVSADSVAKDSSVTYTVALTGHADSVVISYDVNYTVGGITKTQTLNGTGSWTFTQVVPNVQADVDFVINSITANCASFLINSADISISTDHKTLTVGFTSPIDSTITAGNITGTKNAGGTHTITPSEFGGKLVLVFSDALADQDTIDIDAAVFLKGSDTTDNANRNKQGVITVAVDGSGNYTFTVDSSM